MKLTCLVENTPGAGLAGEHGLSVWIEWKGHSLLLDAGSTDLCLRNAEALDIDVSTAEAAFLSHSHFDHSGGFDSFLSRNTAASVYCRREAKRDCCGIREGKVNYIGVPRGLFDRHPDRFVFLEGDVEIMPGLWLLEDPIEHTAQRAAAAGMVVAEGDGYVPDLFRHEQSLVLEEEDGIVVLNSCCHAGVVEILRAATKKFPGRRIKAVVGGFHLMGKDASTLGVAPEEVEAVCRGLEELGVEKLLTGHCTGVPAFDIIRHRMGDRAVLFSTGSQIEL